MKCLTLAISDGISCYPIDFSIHREKGKNKDYGLTSRQLKKQFQKQRNAKNPDYARKAECDVSKLEMASACFVMLSSTASPSSMFLLIVGLRVNRSFMQSVNYVEVQYIILDWSR